jgi:hypothetical protein
MAQELRHAAWQTERSFTVRLVPEAGPPADLASGLTEFLDAFDLASDWVSREDPTRDGTASLAIVETHDGVTEEVWTYTPGQPAAGFTPLTWPGVPEFSNRERRSRLSQRVSAAGNRARAPKALPPSPAWPLAAPPARVIEQREQPAVQEAPRTQAVPREAPRRQPAPREAPRKWIRAKVLAAWDDRLGRVCLIGSGASLWFSVGLADPHFLLPLLVFLPVLWWRDRNRDTTPPETEPEDWL